MTLPNSNTRKDNLDFYLIDLDKEEMDLLLTQPQTLEALAKKYSVPTPEVVDSILRHLDAWQDARVDMDHLFDEITDEDYNISSEGFDALFDEVMR